MTEALRDEIMNLICWFPIASRTRQSAAEDIARVAAGFAAAAVQQARAVAIEECERIAESEEIPRVIVGRIRALVSSSPRPIPMVLHCPRCGVQHVDAPEPDRNWDNPPHKSHLCASCGTIWRPADVQTTGVAAIATKGAADNYVASSPPRQSRVPALDRPVERLMEKDPASVFALADIAIERLRQIDVEGWSADHDDRHQSGELAAAAACYASEPHTPRTAERHDAPFRWPWSKDWWKPSSAVRNRVKAGALLVAEMARHYRLCATCKDPRQGE